MERGGSPPRPCCPSDPADSNDSPPARRKAADPEAPLAAAVAIRDGGVRLPDEGPRRVQIGPEGTWFGTMPDPEWWWSEPLDASHLPLTDPVDPDRAMRHLSLLPLVFAPALLGQTKLTFLEGPTPIDLRLQVIDEADPSATPHALLGGLALLDSEITNRTAQQGLRADRPRRIVQLGVSRIELPDNGRLLRYRRAASTRFGVLWIDDSGAPTILLELAGTGASRTNDPFADRFGVANDGLHAVFVTTAGALHVARLDGQDFASTGTPSRPLAVPGTVVPVSVCVGPTHVFFQTDDDRLWRSPLADAGVPENVTPNLPVGSRLTEAMAPSGDGSAIAFLAGPQDLDTVWLLGTTGPAVALPPPPAKYEEPRYLPETNGGPLLLLDDDATRLMYADATSEDEFYLLDTTGITPTTHVTGDENTEPYIGIGIFPAFASDVLTIALGDPGKFEWFQATTASPLITNLTLTGPFLVPPFHAGTLLPQNAGVTTSGRVLAEEITTTGIALREIDMQTGATMVIRSSLRASAALGRAAGSTPNVLLPGTNGDSLVTPTLATFVAGPAGVLLSPDAQEGTGAFSVFTASLPSGVGAAILRLPSGVLYALPADGKLMEATVTPGGGVVVSGAILLYARPGLPVAFPSTAPVRFVLS